MRSHSMHPAPRKLSPQLVYGLSVAIGLVTGAVALLLLSVSDRLYQFFFHTFAHFDTLVTRSVVVWPWQWTWPMLVVVFVPIAGALLVGALTHWVDPDAAGGGTEQLLRAFHDRAGWVRLRTPWIKWLATAISTGTGSSGGKEGPMLLIGGGFGSLIGRWLRVGERAQRTLLLAGAAGGLGAIFRIPLAGAIIAVEVLYTEDFESDALIPCLISSITAYSLVTFFFGQAHTFWAIPQQPPSWTAVGLFIALAFLCALAGVAYIRFSHAVRDFFTADGMSAPWLRPALGATVVAGLMLWMPHVAGSGIDIVQWALSGALTRDAWYWTVAGFAVLALGKAVASALCVQSGGSSGTLIPCVFIGAMLGGIVGETGHALFPDVNISPAAFMVVGMAGMLSSVTKASLGALIMACELTGGYDLLPYLMGMSIVTLLTTRRHTLYRQQLPNRFASPAHAWEVQRVQNSG